MNKQLKIGLLAAAAIAGLFLLLSWKKKSSNNTGTSGTPKSAEPNSLTEQEKQILFDQASPMYGTRPSAYQLQQREEARKQIEKLGLQSEYDAYNKIQDELPRLGKMA